MASGLNIASGTVASSNTLVATAVGPDLWSIRFNNIGSLKQTVTVQVKRLSNISGKIASPTALTVFQQAIVVGGSGYINNIPVESGDVLLMGTSNASSLNYEVTGVGGVTTPQAPPVDMKVFDASGAVQSGSSATPSVQAITASGTTIINSAAVAAGTPETIVLASSANNATNCLLLPVSTVGQKVTVFNLSGAATLGVFPQVGSAIFAGNTNLGNNAIYNIPAGGNRTFVGGTVTAWYSSLQTSPT